MREDRSRLDVHAFAMTSAVIWGAALPLVTLWQIAREGEREERPWLGLFYPGYRRTYRGSLVGAGWALLDGWAGGAVFAWLYNRLAR